MVPRHGKFNNQYWTHMGAYCVIWDFLVLDDVASKSILPVAMNKATLVTANPLGPGTNVIMWPQAKAALRYHWDQSVYVS